MPNNGYRHVCEHCGMLLILKIFVHLIVFFLLIKSRQSICLQGSYETAFGFTWTEKFPLYI